MSNKKSILEQALLQVQTLEEAVKANSKGILSATVKDQFINLLESIEEEEELKETKKIPVVQPKDVKENSKVRVVKPEDVAEQTVDDEENPEGDDTSLEDDATSLEDGGDSFGNEEDGDDTEGEELPDDGEELEPDLDGEEGIEPEEGDEEEETLDMTGASDGEVLRVFKAMKEEDGLVITRDGNTIELKDGDNDYVIKLDGTKEDTTFGNVAEQWENEYDDTDEDIYEIELDEDEFEDEYGVEDEFNSEYGFEDDVNDEYVGDVNHEEEFTESARTMGFGYHGGLKSKKTFKAGNKREEINEEVKKLKKQNGEYKQALGLFKEKLNEIAVFNANLAFATRLFTEHTTSKKEKLDILKRFDTISTITESKNLYGSIKGELNNKKPLTEVVKDKIISNPKTSTTEILSESKAYENPQFARVRDLMNKIK